MNIHKNGYWEGGGKKVLSEHYFDTSLARYLTTFFKAENAKSVVDFGCGLGDYVKTFQTNGIHASGFDGNPCTPDLTNGICKVLDLSTHVTFDEPYT